MEALQNGEREALAVLYERYAEKLCRYLQRMPGDEHRAEDLVQEVFEKLVREPERFDSSRTLSSWIYTVSGNLGRNELRSRQQQKKFRLEEQHSGEKDILQQHRLDSIELQRRIQRIFNELTTREQQIYRLRFEQHLSIKEIARTLQLPEGSVKSGLFYLLKKFTSLQKTFGS